MGCYFDPVAPGRLKQFAEKFAEMQCAALVKPDMFHFCKSCCGEDLPLASRAFLHGSSRPVAKTRDWLLTVLSRNRCINFQSLLCINSHSLQTVMLHDSIANLKSWQYSDAQRPFQKTISSMMTARNTLYEAMARQSLEEDAHFVTRVTKMADHKEVIALEDICAANGIKLIPKNTIIGSGLREKLLNHTFLKPIEQSLMVRDGVTAQSLATQVASLTEEDPNLRYLAAGSGNARVLSRGLARLPLSAQMAFKLTVAKQQHPHLFHHLLLVTLIAHYLAVRGKLSANDLDRVLYAALFHDLGELHTDPAVLNATHHLSEIEWRHIYVHPITGYLIAREAAELDPAVPIAILQHHERLDGSGYPYGLRGAQIGSLARIISVADVCASIFARFGSNERLSALMRLNRQKYDPELLALAHEGFGRPASQSAVAEIAALPRLKAVAQLLERWGKLHAALSGTGGNSPPGELEFLFERMADLRSMLLQFGFDPERSQLLVALAEADPQVANELAAALDEIHWQFTDLERETSRHRETIRAVLRTDENRLLDGWIAELRAYVAAP